jgi:hypothetical protein
MRNFIRRIRLFLYFWIPFCKYKLLTTSRLDTFQMLHHSQEPLLSPRDCIFLPQDWPRWKRQHCSTADGNMFSINFITVSLKLTCTTEGAKAKPFSLHKWSKLENAQRYSSSIETSKSENFLQINYLDNGIIIFTCRLNLEWLCSVDEMCVTLSIFIIIAKSQRLYLPPPRLTKVETTTL